MSHRYKSNEVEIEAAHWNGSTPKATAIIDWILESGGTASFKCGGQCCNNVLAIDVDTLQGMVKAWPQDYIVKGTQGEFYPCHPSVFQTKYHKVEGH